VRAGAETLHLIYLDPSLSNVPMGASQSTLDVMSRLLTIQFACKMNADIAAAKRINQELTAVARFQQRHPELAGANELLEGLFRGGTRAFQNMTIHRYHPHDDVSGVLGLLDFDRDRIAGLIQRGYRDAIEHDCHASQCVMPDGSYAA
jgi:hypothetical protein